MSTVLKWQPQFSSWFIVLNKTSGQTEAGIFEIFYRDIVTLWFSEHLNHVRAFIIQYQRERLAGQEGTQLMIQLELVCHSRR